jgi:SAM-dependent methyltransferase
MTSTPCKICGGETEAIGVLPGAVTPREFHFRRCLKCDFVAVDDPRLDFAAVYDDAYYHGKGADPFVDYYTELERPQSTVRQYEWRGIHRVVRELLGDIGPRRWLDYGCGNGCLVRYLRDTASIDAVGFDEGAIVDAARANGIPILSKDELERAAGCFSVVTLIEVIEHVPDPLPFLRNVRRFLKPGGLLFLTTGNSAPYRNRFLKWRYIHPEVHVSYFNPRNMRLALEASGFRAEFPGYVAGWDDIIRFKFLKNVRAWEIAPWERMLPWRLLSRALDLRVKPSAHPVGRAV